MVYSEMQNHYGSIIKKGAGIIIISLLVATYFNSCENSNQAVTKIPVTDTGNTVLANDSTITLDTTINISNISSSNYSGNQLSGNLAKQVLYSFFKKKGDFISGKVPSTILAADSNKLEVEYDTIYFADINKNKFRDAVISYWLTPPHASGHCWQPHKAIIIDTDSGYKITNEEFIPTNYSIDSIQSNQGSTKLFGYDYDCGNKKIIRQLRLTLKWPELVLSARF